MLEEVIQRNRKLSMESRRRSTMMYLEKYGLDQPNWHTTASEDSAISSPDSKHQPIRPVSFRNSVQSTHLQKRPLRFLKPEKTGGNINVEVSVPTEFKNIHQFIETYHSKPYMEGYLYKRNDLNSDGSSCLINDWKVCYVELCGPILTIWDAETREDEEVIPHFINITDAVIQAEDHNCVFTEAHHLFSLNSAGANRFLFQTLSEYELHEWLSAIYLSCFECTRIQEFFTNIFISRPQFKTIMMSKMKIFKGDYVQVRFPGATGWNTYWAVVSNYRVEKKLFCKKTILTDGQVMFFESKKSKHPIMILDKVVQAYTVYPESPKLIRLNTLFKMEGSLYQNQKLVHASSHVLIMTQDSQELVSWILSVFDAFQLYGRPRRLFNDPKNPKALNFGDLERCHSNLFLNLQDVMNIDSNLNLLASKKEYSILLYHKLLRKESIQTNPECCKQEKEDVVQQEPHFNKRRSRRREKSIMRISLSGSEISESNEEYLASLRHLSINTNRFSTGDLDQQLLYSRKVSFEETDSPTTASSLSSSSISRNQKNYSHHRISMSQWPNQYEQFVKRHGDGPPIDGQTPITYLYDGQSPASFYSANSIGYPTDEDENVPIGNTLVYNASQKEKNIENTKPQPFESPLMIFDSRLPTIQQHMFTTNQMTINKLSYHQKQLNRTRGSLRLNISKPSSSQNTTQQ